MAERQLVGPAAPRTGPDSASPSTWSGHALPADILREASRRLSITAALMSVLYAVGWALGRATTMELLGPEVDGRLLGADLLVTASVLASLGVWHFARRAEHDPQRLLDLGLGYMVAISFSIGSLMHWVPVPHHWPITPMITWIGPIMLTFAAILPNNTVKTVFAGLLAVSMNPLSMILAKSRGHWDYGAETNVLLMHYPDYLLVPVAVVISKVMRGLGLQVASAREMGSYRLGERIGLGAMGEVYKATHRMFARPAAIKLIRADVIAPGDTDAATLAVRRFRREAEAAAQLRNPHTVALYDFGVTSDQTLYFVMELLEGMDLQSIVREYGPMPANRVVYILRQVCDSLEEAHASGLVHRDIKPANIHLGRVGLKHDFVKVLDFGLVKSLDGDGARESLATEDGLTPGTPAYMPPEAVRGEALDGRADIYALACVGYYLLTGELVFEADSGLKMIAKHLQDRPTPPSARSNVAVPKALEDLILRCLAKNPEDRPSGADAVGRALKAIPIDPWTQAEAMAWWQTHGQQTQKARAS